MPEEKVVQNVNYKNIAKPTPLPNPVDSVDTTGIIYDDIIDGYESGSVNLGAIQALTSISQARDRVYSLIDIMTEDPIISIALDIYTSDACARSQAGQIVWCESSDEKVLKAVNYILSKTNVDKNIRSWMYNLIKYGDTYIRLYRKSEVEDKVQEKAQLKEEMILKAFAPSDRYAKYVEMQKNPAEMFELYKFGKSVGYVRAHIQSRDLTDKVLNPPINQYSYDYDLGDVDIYAASSYVHACMDDNTNRLEEKLSISQTYNKDSMKTYTYAVRRGRSMLCNIFKIWRTLTLLENSVLINRLTQSSIIRAVNVEIGDMEKQEARKLLGGIKQLIEQKSAINPGNNFEEYLNAGAVINTIYNTTRDGIGALSVETIGGDVNVGDLVDLDYFKNKLYGSLGIPKQYLGDTDDATGFNGGTALALTSSRYATNVKVFQTAMCQAITDMVNLMLFDDGHRDYIGQFQIKMEAPMTQEEKDRQENMSTALTSISDTIRLLSDAGIEDNLLSLKIIREMLPKVITNQNVLSLITEKIEEMEEEKNQPEEAETSTEEDSYSEDMEMPDTDALTDTYEPNDTFGQEESGTYSEEPTTSETFGEEQTLPSFSDMNVSYDEV